MDEWYDRPTLRAGPLGSVESIPGARGPRYVVSELDLGCHLRCVVARVNSHAGPPPPPPTSGAGGESGGGGGKDGGVGGMILDSGIGGGGGGGDEQVRIVTSESIAAGHRTIPHTTRLINPPLSLIVRFEEPRTTSTHHDHVYSPRVGLESSANTHVCV